MLFLIPARAGSKRLPGKNKRLFCGLPLYQWSVATACRIAGPTDTIVVSTDDRDILRECPFAMERAPMLSGDKSPTSSLVEIFLDDDDVCLLQPTSPTRADSLVRRIIATYGMARSTYNGDPTGECYVYRKGFSDWVDVPADRGHDIDDLAGFQAAEQDMLRRFA